jgi:hypothetical protein
MNSTLNSLALLSFKRKARKFGKNIEVANLTDQGFFEEYLVRAGETLIIWSEENGFHSIFTENDKELAYLVEFPDKYGYDEVYHFGILNKDKTKLYVYRCYDQCPSGDKMVPFGLHFQTDEYKKDEEFDDGLSHLTSLAGTASCG